MLQARKFCVGAASTDATPHDTATASDDKTMSDAADGEAKPNDEAEKTEADNGAAKRQRPVAYTSEPGWM